MGNKYIIELEDEPFYNNSGEALYRVKGFNSLVFDTNGIIKLRDYLESVTVANNDRWRAKNEKS